VFMEKYPDAVLVATAKTFPILEAFFETDAAERRKVVKEGDSLILGRHELVFYMAPFVHWPEVMMTYDTTEGILFSADAFGKFGTFACKEDWACEARRYYFGIVGKFGTAVQNVLKKLPLDKVQIICPLHGPVLKENLSYYTELYDIWSSYAVESEGVLIAVASVYGNTRKAAEYLKKRLIEKGCRKVVVTDLCREDMAEAIEDAFRYGTLVLASVTYNGTLFPPMREFLANLKERNYQNRKVALIENGCWAPAAAKGMRAALEGCKNLHYAEPVITLKGSPKQENCTQLLQLADILLDS